MPDAIIIDQRTVERLAREHLAPHQAEWYILQRYGNSDRGIPEGLSDNALAKRLRVVQSTLTRNLRHAEQILLPLLQEEYQKRKSLPTLVYVRATAPDCTSYDITLAEGRKTRTLQDRTQRKAVEGSR